MERKKGIRRYRSYATVNIIVKLTEGLEISSCLHFPSKMVPSSTLNDRYKSLGHRFSDLSVRGSLLLREGRQGLAKTFLSLAVLLGWYVPALAKGGANALAILTIGAVLLLPFFLWLDARRSESLPFWGPWWSHCRVHGRLDYS